MEDRKALVVSVIRLLWEIVKCTIKFLFLIVEFIGLIELIKMLFF